MSKSLHFFCSECNAVTPHRMEKIEPIDHVSSIYPHQFFDQIPCRHRHRSCVVCSNLTGTVEISLNDMSIVEKYLRHLNDREEFLSIFIAFLESEKFSYIQRICLYASYILALEFSLSPSLVLGRVQETNLNRSSLFRFAADVEHVLSTLDAKESLYLWPKVDTSLSTTVGGVSHLSMLECDTLIRKLRHPSRSRHLRKWHTQFNLEDL